MLNMKTAKSIRTKLARTDWLDAAIDTLSTAGVGSVSIVQLAIQLRVTRGSFYHHFSDRDDLLRSMLDYWEQVWTLSLRDQIRMLEVSPIEKLVALVKLIRQKKAAEFDAPFRAWALYDLLACGYLKRVDSIRLGYIKSLFEAAGFEGLDAENRARLLLFYEMSDAAFFAKSGARTERQLTLRRLRMLLELPETYEFNVQP